MQEQAIPEIQILHPPAAFCSCYFCSCSLPTAPIVPLPLLARPRKPQSGLQLLCRCSFPN